MLASAVPAMLAASQPRLSVCLCRQRYIDEAMRTYTWTPVEGTDYRYVGNQARGPDSECPAQLFPQSCSG